jgi:hypothetical protein
LPSLDEMPNRWEAIGRIAEMVDDTDTVWCGWGIGEVPQDWFGSGLRELLQNCYLRGVRGLIEDCRNFLSAVI